MFRSITQQLVNGGQPADGKKSMSPTLRSDLYEAFDQVKAWLTGALGAGQAGDGVSYKAILALVQKHFPDLKVGLECIGHAEHEAAVIVGGVTNMVMELSKWEPMAGGVAARTWADTLVESQKRAAAGSRKDAIAKGIMRGLDYNADVTLMTKEFTARIGMISPLKSVSSRLFGIGSEEARQSEAIWSSKFM